ncbi:MAG: type IV secretory system conjugative DNA transfer family protein [Ruminococcus flavefaciens]|nr:type IV secretory system conjugative DNA transfer family protein [Ruminococcus flavefaciens]
MGIVYDKSVSQKYKKYFKQIPELTKSFHEYSLKRHRIISKKAEEARIWEEGEAGVPLAWNKAEGTVAVDHRDSHTMVIGPTGSKKSRLVAMPLVHLLGSARESMIIADPKAEIYNRTASYLQEQNYKIFVLNLRSPMHGNCWNPLAIPYDFFCNGEIDKAYEFVNDIAENLIQSEKSQSEPFWDNSAGSLFFGLVLLLFKYCRDYKKGREYIHIGNVIRLRRILFEKNMNATRLWKYAQSDAYISSALIGTVGTAKDTQAGILSTFDQKVRMFSIQPNLMDMLSVNSIDFDEVGSRPTAVFLIVPDEKTGYHRLVSLFIKQSYEYMIHRAQYEVETKGFQVGRLENRVNYILDEFSSLPTIKDFPAMITAARSRNIRFTLIIQSKHQLIQRYEKEAETIQTNCNNWIFFTSKELQLLEELSSMCGKTSSSPPKPILSVSLLQRLDKESGEALLMCDRFQPCITRLPDIDFYDNRQFGRVVVRKRETNDLRLLDFSVPLSQEELEMENQRKILSQFNMEKPMDIARIDAMIEEIDKKIEELDKKEKEE